VVGHDQSEYRVAEELEALVGRGASRLGAPGAVRESLFEQAGVVEGAPEPLLQGMGA
jgi:hypothetical protein